MGQPCQCKSECLQKRMCTLMFCSSEAQTAPISIPQKQTALGFNFLFVIILASLY
jgi:hypothetical protein